MALANKQTLHPTGNVHRGLVAYHGLACPLRHFSLGSANFIRGIYKSLNAIVLRGGVGCTCHGLLLENGYQGEGLLPVPHNHAQEISFPLR